MVFSRTYAAIAEDPEFFLQKKLQPGDIEWIHNPTIHHSRTEVHQGKVCIWVQVK